MTWFPVRNSNITYNGVSWNVQNAGNPWNNYVNGPIVGFQTRPGDFWNASDETRAVPKWRSEWGNNGSLAGTGCWIAYAVRCLFTPDTDIVAGQYHQQLTGFDPSPPFACHFGPDGTVYADTRFNPDPVPTASGPENIIWQEEYTPGTWLSLVAQIMPNTVAGAATVNLWVGGVLVGSSTSAGYTGSTNDAEKIGCYASATNEHTPRVVEYANPELFTTGAGFVIAQSRIANPLPIPGVPVSVA